jgi:peptide/nickel transport system substrate-binding protein
MRYQNPTISIALLLIVLFAFGCKKNEGVPRSKTLVTSILADANFLNPVIASTLETALINEQLYPTLLITDFDTAKGFLEFRVDEGSLAESFSISEDSRAITYKLRQTSKWNDGTPISSADIRFSYELYGDTAVKSLRQQYLSDLVRKESGEIDFEKAIEWSSKAVTIATENKDKQLEQLESELKSYQEKKPWREKIETKENKAPIAPGVSGVDT